MDTAFEIERLLQYGCKHKLLKGQDVLVARNTLLDLFGLDAPYAGETALPKKVPDTPTELLEGLLDAAAAAGLFDNSVNQYRVNFEARIMGALMPRESECVRKFHKLYEKKGPEAALRWFYTLCVDSNYIRTAQIALNQQWTTETDYGTLEITINLTKPEKDPKTIALERAQPSSGYPKCMLCKENIGYAGRINFPARQTHRIIPLTLAGSRYYLQYSPYAYFNEHCIVLHEEHKPMEMDGHTLEEIFDFVCQFPQYTCGSNANLPIVGGSILSHAHFQGGRYVFPMTKAVISDTIHSKAYKHVLGGMLHWPVSTLRLYSTHPDELLAAGTAVLEAWQKYEDTSVDILAFTGDVPHNTVTPILHYDADLGYVLDLALRNNRTSDAYPDGIFHPHAQWHNIKKENIGLIEVMGLAILPSRLKVQSAAICNILTGKAPNTARTPGDALAVHADWIDALVQKYGTGMHAEEAALAVQKEIGLVFSHVLEDAGVFKQDEAGQAAFRRFVQAAGFTVK